LIGSSDYDEYDRDHDDDYDDNDYDKQQLHDSCMQCCDFYLLQCMGSLSPMAVSLGLDSALLGVSL
jgi:hypothetical protein